LAAGENLERKTGKPEKNRSSLRCLMGKKGKTVLDEGRKRNDPSVFLTLIQRGGGVFDETPPPGGRKKSATATTT